MDKQKQMIEEMAKEISRILFEDCLLNMGGRCEDCECNSKDKKEHDCQSYLVAKKLLEKYQPKIPEGAVVLTKEEHIQILKDLAGSNKIAYASGYGKGSTETAEKFAEMLKDEMDFYLVADEHGNMHYVDLSAWVDEICKEITEGCNGV